MKKIVTEATSVAELEILKAKHGVTSATARRNYETGKVSVSLICVEGLILGEGDSLAEALNVGFNNLIAKIAKTHYNTVH